MIFLALFCLLMAYIVGAFPIGFLIARMQGISDIRRHGSGNSGATNVARVLGLHYFMLIFLLDAGKAYLCLLLIHSYCNDSFVVLMASLLLLIGNSYSWFLNGSGGKGVATSYGIIAAVCPQYLVISLLIWIICLVIIRTVGIASVIASIALPWYAWYTKSDNQIIVLLCFMMIFILWRHKNNLMHYLRIRTINEV